MNKKKSALSKVMSDLGKQSGKRMTAKQRSERGRKAVQARWDKVNKKQVTKK